MNSDDLIYHVNQAARYLSMASGLVIASMGCVDFAPENGVFSSEALMELGYGMFSFAAIVEAYYPKKHFGDTTSSSDTLLEQSLQD